jgi:hypothetical protein
MTEEKVLIAFREDLLEGYRSISINDLEFIHLNVGSMTKFLTQPMVIFVDHDMETKILKNRYGYNGIVTRPIRVKPKLDDK